MNLVTVGITWHGSEISRFNGNLAFNISTVVTFLMMGHCCWATQIGPTNRCRIALGDSSRPRFISTVEAKSLLDLRIKSANARVLLVGEQHYDSSARKYNYDLVLQSLNDQYPNSYKILFLEFPGNAGWTSDLENVVNRYLRKEVSYGKVEETFAWPCYNLIPPTKELLDKGASLGFTAKCVDQMDRLEEDVNSYMADQIVRSIGKKAVGVFIVGRSHLNNQFYLTESIPTLLRRKRINLVMIASFELGGFTNSTGIKKFLETVPNGVRGVVGFSPGEARVILGENKGSAELASDYDLTLVFAKR